MNQSLLMSLAHYNAYANRAVIATAAKLPVEELSRTPSPSRSSVLLLIRHLFVTEAHFLAQCQGKTFKFDPQTLTSVEELKIFVEQLETDLITLVSSLSEADLQQMKAIEIGGHPFRFPIWQILIQVFMHSAQHRGELSVLLTSLGQPLPIQDIIVEFAEQSGQPWPWK